MEPRKLTDTERNEVFNTMLGRIQKDHPTWRLKHIFRYAHQLTDRFAKDFASGKIMLVEEKIVDDDDDE